MSISLMVSALIVFWLTWIVMGIGTRVLESRIKPMEAVLYIGRATVVTLMLCSMVWIA